MAAVAESDVADQMRMFRADVDYFVTFFRHNEQFVPKGAEFSRDMVASLERLKGIDNVDQAKEFFFRGSIALHLTKRYLETVMMFQFWNSLLACKHATHHQDDACQRLQAIVRHNNKLFANQGTKDGLFRSESECLATPRSETCHAEWNRARRLLNDRMKEMMTRFDTILRVQLRQYFRRRPAVVPTELHATVYKRQELVQALQNMHKNVVLEVHSRNRELMQEMTHFMSIEIKAHIQSRGLQDQQRLEKLTTDLQLVLAQAHAKLVTLTPPVTEPVRAQEERDPTTDELWNTAFGTDSTLPPAASEAAVEDCMSQITQLRMKLNTAFSIMDDMVVVLEEHQTDVAQKLDQMQQDLQVRISALEQDRAMERAIERQRTSDVDQRLVALERNADQDGANVDRRLAALEERLHSATAVEQTELARLKDQVRSLQSWRARMMTLLASVMFLSIVAILSQIMIETAQFEFDVT